MLAILSAAFQTATADIYFWTDENGVKNFTNYSPPEKAEVFMETSAVDEDTSLREAETDRTENKDRTLESEQLQAAAEEIEALREQIGELTDRLAALPEAPPIDAYDTATEAEEASNTVRYGGGYVYWPFPYGYHPYRYKGYKLFGSRHGYGRPGYKKRFAHPNRIKTRRYGRNLSQPGHKSIGQRSSYQSLRKRAHHTGSGSQRHRLGVSRGFAGVHSRGRR
jgi:hypothetical protein